MARKAASEDEEKERLARLEEKLAAAEERRLAQAEEQRAKVKAAAEHLREVKVGYCRPFSRPMAWGFAIGNWQLESSAGDLCPHGWTFEKFSRGFSGYWV